VVNLLAHKENLTFESQAFLLSSNNLLMIFIRLLFEDSASHSLGDSKELSESLKFQNLTYGSALKDATLSVMSLFEQPNIAMMSSRKLMITL
jgi:hypothetical protein